MPPIPANPLPVMLRAAPPPHRSYLALLLAIPLACAVTLSLNFDFKLAEPQSLAVRSGLVRSDQLVRDMSYEDLLQSSVLIRRRVAADPANPYRWAELGEHLVNLDRFDEAEAAFERATTLAPEIPPILMRAANFYFQRDQPGRLATVGKKILGLTSDFDSILFINYAASGLNVEKILNSALPQQVRASRAFLTSILAAAKSDDILLAWNWLRNHNLTDAPTTEKLVTTLWQRHLYADAVHIWADSLASDRGDYLRPNLLSNRRFSSPPRPVPFDWQLGNAGEFGVHDNALHLKFTGSDPGSMFVAAQLVPIVPGAHQFRAAVSADAITTDEGPYFRFYDAEKIERFNLLMPAFVGSHERQTVRYDFTVPSGTRVLGVQIERRGSLKFDNKIKGELIVHETSLL